MKRPSLRALPKPIAATVALMCLYLTLVSIMQFTRNTKHVTLPNGASIGRKHWLARPQAIHLWSPEGHLITPEAIDFICANNKFIEAHMKNGGAFLYSIDEETLIHATEDHFHKALKNSQLIGRSGQCMGYLQRLTGTQQILKDPTVFHSEKQN